MHTLLPTAILNGTRKGSEKAYGQGSEKAYGQGSEKAYGQVTEA